MVGWPIANPPEEMPNFSVQCQEPFFRMVPDTFVSTEYFRFLHFCLKRSLTRQEIDERSDVKQINLPVSVYISFG